jgi:protein-glucosylgalactosylhydroxylysine glucosidase
MIQSKVIKLFGWAFLTGLPCWGFAQKINRKAVIQRHQVSVSQLDTLSSLSVGNGKFAFTVDVTGLQTFPDFYANGIPLGTQSEWGWHKFPNVGNYQIEETLKDLESHGRKVPYATQWNEPKRKKEASDFIRQNPHRLQLGNLGFELFQKDGNRAKPTDIQQITQTLNPYTGEIKSHFVFDGETVDIQTFCHQQKDIIAAKIKSNLIKLGQLKIRLRLPYPTDKFIDAGNNWKSPEKHSSKIVNFNSSKATINHTLDQDQYFIHLSWNNHGKVQEFEPHYFVFEPSKESDILTINCEFSEKRITENTSFSAVQNNSIFNWYHFWNTGGAIDFAGSTDPRANELERQIILSEYLTKIQCAGSAPPQETGLTYNSWFGKPHLEMHWWHGVHFALWGRPELLEKSLSWYKKALPNAIKIAKRQGFAGARWQKMTDNNGGETASSVGSYLIWQQPHIITFSELVYRQKPSRQILDKYKDLVFKTADFMTSFAYFDKEKGKYILGKGIISAQERFKPEDTFNPTYELNYWFQALTIAQNWRKRLGLTPDVNWQKVLDNLSPLPTKDGVYLATENATDSYTNPKYLTDHPAVLCTLGMLPETPMVDKATMKRTFDKIWEIWDWQDTWGWDFPMVAMTATRLDMPEKAIDGLMMKIRTNTYLPNGHNFQDGRLRLYLPGNGGLLTAVALMCAGYDHCQTPNPGFPKDGSWKVKWEGLEKFF